MSDEQPTPWQELMHLLRVRRDDEVAYWRDKWTHYVRKPLKRLPKWYLARAPWWALPSLWSSVWDRLKPDVKYALRLFPRHRGMVRVVDQIERLGECFPDYFSWVSSRHSGITGTVVVMLRVRDTLEDVRPFLTALLSWGWEVDRIEDSKHRREWKLKHPGEGYHPSIYVKASTRFAEECHVVEREIEQPPKTEYEIVCPGEEELVGEVPA